MIDVELKLDDRFKRKLALRYGRYELRAGVLKDGRHRSALPAARGLTSVAGGPARKMSNQSSGTLKQVSDRVRRTHRVDYLREPLKHEGTPEMRAFRRALADLLTGKTKRRERAEAALQAVIQRPIAQGKYGRNSFRWARIKGFNRKLIDTGQFYRSIIARLRSARNVQG